MLADLVPQLEELKEKIKKWGLIFDPAGKKERISELQEKMAEAGFGIIQRRHRR